MPGPRVNFRTLDLNLLRVFGAVMVERNVTRAAAQLAMTQPAVSNALRRLREATGDELFVTVPGGVQPTSQADAWWPEVRTALDALRAVFDPQGFDPTRDERSFAVAMADATATVLMPAIVDAFVRRHAGATCASCRCPRATRGRSSRAAGPTSPSASSPTSRPRSRPKARAR